jgi:TolA-binding protein
MVEFKRVTRGFSESRACDRLKSMNAEEKIAYLEEALSKALAKIQGLEEQCREMQKLQEQLQRVSGDLQQSQEQLQKAQARIAELEKLKTPPPAFVKENKKKLKEGEKKPRAKREARYNRARARSTTPTETVEHRVVNCPDCEQRLGGITLARSREVIDIQPPPPVVIKEHRIDIGLVFQLSKVA